MTLVNPKLGSLLIGGVVAAACTATDPADDAARWRLDRWEPDGALLGVWGSSPDDVWVAGGQVDRSLLLHGDGDRWTDVGVDAGSLLWGIYGFSGKDIYAVGDRGLILHYDGARWSQVESGTDQTLFGVGATGGAAGGGTTLGRIGFGYIYPQFKAQMTYSTPAGRPGQLSIGIFQPATNPPYETVQLPRLEAEGVYTSGNTKVWVGALAQSNKTPEGLTDETAFASGGNGGVRFGTSTFSVTATGYYGKGIGTTLMFLNGAAGAGTGGDDLRKSYGGYGQVSVTPANSKVTVAGSWGISILDAADAETEFKTKNWLASGGIYYQATKSLKVVGEFNYAVTNDDVDATDENKEIAPAVGLMLFF